MTIPCVNVDRISDLEQKTALTNNDISYMKKDISEIKRSQKEINNKIDRVLDSMGSRYASKWVERVVKGLIGLILISVFGALLKIVLIS